MNNYQLNDEIGKGSYSTVYKGRRRKTIDYYAISSIEKCRRQHVLNSVQTLRSLTHTNVIRFHNWYETNNHLWVIAEYCTGGDLRSILHSGEKLSSEAVRAFGRDIAEGLMYIHSQGILNNDVKPSNFLMDATAALRYYDFSLSCTFDTAADRAVAGAPLYMAPELFLVGKGASSMASDLWSFGCVLYEMSTGQPLFVAETLEGVLTNILTKPFQPIPGSDNEPLNALLKVLLEKNPLKRAKWADVVTSKYWEGKLQLQTFPKESIFESFSSAYRSRFDSLDARQAVTSAVEAAKANLLVKGRISGEGALDNTELDKETDFTTGVTPAGFAPIDEGVPSKPSAARKPSTSTSVDSRRASSVHGVASKTEATKEANTSSAAPNRRGSAAVGMTKQYQSATTGTTRRGNSSANAAGADDRFTKAQITAFSAGAFAKINMDELLLHNSDAHIRPLCMNNRIEQYVEPPFDKDRLGFTPQTLKEVKALSSSDLTQFVTTVYRPLSSSSTSFEAKLNIMRYFETICTDPVTANVLVNSSVMTLCVKLAGQSQASPEFRAAAASIMGLLVRHTTFIHVDLSKSRVVPNTVALFQRESDVLVQRKLLACIGEFLFYIAVRPEEERSPWGLTASDIEEIYLRALSSSDDVLKHYACKAVENLASLQDKHMAKFAFCSPKVVESLLSVYSSGANSSREDHMRSSALCAAVKLAMTDENLIATVLNSTTVPLSSYKSIVQSTPIHRTAQLLLTFVCYALLRSMVATSNVYVDAWIDNNKSSALLKPSTLTAAAADHTIAELGDLSDEIAEGVCEGLEGYSAASRGKTLVFYMLVGCIGGTTFSRMCSSRHVSYMDRIMRETDKYIEKCTAAFTVYLSLFVSEKLGCVSQRVSSTTTPFYLSALQQILGSSAMRAKSVLQKDVFKSLSECIEKCLSSTIYAAYEDSFNTLSERLSSTPETVLQYYEPICTYLVRPYTEMLLHKESQRRFGAIRYLTSVVIPFSSDSRLTRDSTATNSVSLIVSTVCSSLQVLLEEMNPIPSFTLRLLVACGEWMPKALLPCVSEGFFRNIVQYLTTTKDIDVSPPLSLVHLALFNSGRDEYITFLAQNSLPSFIIKTLPLAISKGLDSVVDSCCELAAYILRRVVGDPSSKSAQLCVAFGDNDSITQLFLPLCNGDSSSKLAAESSASVVHDLVRLSSSAQHDMLSPVGVDTLTDVLKKAKPNEALVSEFLLKAMRLSAENQKKGDLQKLSSNDAFLSALSGCTGPSRSRTAITEASKLYRLLKS